MLYRRFQKLDRGQKGVITVGDLRMIPEVSMNPLADRVIVLFDREGTGRINFLHFLETIAVLSNRSKFPERRAEALLRIYDVDGDGRVSLEDLKAVVKLQVADNLSAAQIEEVARRMLTAADFDGDGALSLADMTRTGAAIRLDSVFALPIGTEDEDE